MRPPWTRFGKLKEIAARTLGGVPEHYDIGNERVFQRSNPTRQLTFAAAAQQAIDLGGPVSVAMS